MERVGWLFIFSLSLWLSALLGLWNDGAALVLLMAGFVIGFPLLEAAYRRMYEKYRAQRKNRNNLRMSETMRRLLFV